MSKNVVGERVSRSVDWHEQREGVSWWGVDGGESRAWNEQLGLEVSS